jgi:hypothetical protein
MKAVCCSLGLLLLCLFAQAQIEVRLRNLWVEPSIHVFFGEYQLSFATKDVRKSIKLLGQDGIKIDTTLWPDTTQKYVCELYPGLHQRYKQPIEELLQHYSAAYLLSIGKAEVRNKKRKGLTSIIVDIQYPELHDEDIMVSCYDPSTKVMLFQGVLPRTLLARDIGLDD